MVSVCVCVCVDPLPVLTDRRVSPPADRFSFKDELRTRTKSRPLLILLRVIAARRSVATASRRAAVMRGRSFLKRTERQHARLKDYWVTVIVCQIFVPAVLDMR